MAAILPSVASLMDWEAVAEPVHRLRLAFLVVAALSFLALPCCPYLEHDCAVAARTFEQVAIAAPQAAGHALA